MQAVCSTSASVVKGVSLARRTSRAGPVARPAIRGAVVCKAQQNAAAKAAAVAASVPAFLAAHPALALVDDRLNGDGTGKILGIAFGPEGWAILLVFTLVWALFYAATKDVGDGRGSGEDSGLTL
eukprot:jgi/Botrbrau1/3575/Bobra.0078s0030.1